MNDYHMMKAMGYLPTVECKDVDTAMITPSPDAQSAVKNRGCFTPDFPDEEIAKTTDPGKLANCLHCAEEDGFTEEDGVELARHLITSHQRMLNRSTGSGSWPFGCDPDYPNHHVYTFHIEKDTFPSEFFHEPVTQQDLEDLIKAKVWGPREKVMDLYAGRKVIDVAQDLYVITDSRINVYAKWTEDGDNANVVIRGKRIPGSVIGYAYFNNGRCDDQVDHFLDINYRPHLKGFTQLKSHEGGHNKNFDHQFRREHIHHGIMSYDDPHLYFGYSTGKDPHVLPRDPSRDDAEEFFGVGRFQLPDSDPEPINPEDPAVDWPEVMVKINGVYVPYVPKGGTPSPDPDPVWEV